jgi:hypothetical protein
MKGKKILVSAICVTLGGDRWRWGDDDSRDSRASPILPASSTSSLRNRLAIIG